MTRSRYPNEVNAQPWKLSKEEQDEYAGSCFNPSARAQCQETLHFGFFFDGTRNNMKYDKANLDREVMQ
ncbi:MAG: hypothetical protein LBP94_05090 [Zoogloeaceae bacterium]|jgi:hypothetical protein|nr:hypothetical protein [Zoogloeaceae bacterium]